MTDNTSKITRAHRVPFFVPLLNPIVARLLRIGIPVGPMILLTVRGRRTGQPRTTPIVIFERDGRRYVFATFGEVNWVRNLRAAGEAVLTRGWRRQAVVAVELTPQEAMPVLKDAVAPYLSSPVAAVVLRPQFDVAPDASLSDFLSEARRHPVFEVRDSHAA